MSSPEATSLKKSFSLKQPYYSEAKSIHGRRNQSSHRPDTLPLLSAPLPPLEPINTFHGIHQNNDEPIRVSYHRNIHYNSVVNPNKATIGVGLGLPAFKPGVTTSNTLPDFSEASLCIVGAVVHASKQRSVF